jgi:hypothetical protein
MLLTLLAVAAVSADDSFRSYTTVDGRFTVRMPIGPKTERKQLAVGNGVSVPVVTTKADGRDGLVFAVVYADYPPDLNVPADKLLTGAVTGLKGKDGKLTSDKSFRFGPDKLPAREVVIEAGNRARNAVRAHLIVADQRLYQVMVTGPKAAVANRSADEFLKSFELTR